MYEWDDDKNRKNVEKHGIDFETAKRVFDSPIVSRRDERKDYNEIRYVSIGIIDQVAMIVVVHTSRQGRIRLISARPA